MNIKSVHQAPLAFCTLVGMVYLTAISSAFAHPFHTTTAEMEFNEHTGRYEVSLKVLTADLAKARGSGLVHVGATSDNTRDRRAVAEYLRPRFYVDRSSGPPPTNQQNPSNLELVGIEPELAYTWLYFELSPTEGEGSFILTNKVFTDINDGQINICLLRISSKRVSLKTDATQPRVFMPNRD